mmetsp:Transcript_14200/g.31047  ORF Transcript_14200/g.31047 Transcript_14200/m.31047 type:complete len:229 (+) Transcript_14200:871-1557(+)
MGMAVDVVTILVLVVPMTVGQRGEGLGRLLNLRSVGWDDVIDRRRRCGDAFRVHPIAVVVGILCLLLLFCFYRRCIRRFILYLFRRRCRRRLRHRFDRVRRRFRRLRHHLRRHLRLRLLFRLHRLRLALDELRNPHRLHVRRGQQNRPGGSGGPMHRPRRDRRPSRPPRRQTQTRRNRHDLRSRRRPPHLLRLRRRRPRRRRARHPPSQRRSCRRQEVRRLVPPEETF